MTSIRLAMENVTQALERAGFIEIARNELLGPKHPENQLVWAHPHGCLWTGEARYIEGCWMQIQGEIIIQLAGSHTRERQHTLGEQGWLWSKPVLFQNGLQSTSGRGSTLDLDALPQLIESALQADILPFTHWRQANPLTVNRHRAIGWLKKEKLTSAHLQRWQAREQHAALERAQAIKGLPDLVSALQQGEPSLVRVDGAVMDIQHAPLPRFIAAVDAYQPGEPSLRDQRILAEWSGFLNGFTEELPGCLDSALETGHSLAHLMAEDVWMKRQFEVLEAMARILGEESFIRVAGAADKTGLNTPLKMLHLQVMEELSSDTRVKHTPADRIPPLLDWMERFERYGALHTPTANVMGAFFHHGFPSSMVAGRKMGYRLLDELEERFADHPLLRELPRWQSTEGRQTLDEAEYASQMSELYGRRGERLLSRRILRTLDESVPAVPIRTAPRL